MQFRTAFPAALLVGSMLGGVMTAAGGSRPSQLAGLGDLTPAPGLIREAAAASAVRFDIPMVRNESVEHFVEELTGPQSDEMARYLKQSGRYEGMIRAKLRARGMPEDLVYLTLIESGFNPTARSRVNAVGLWQFMAGTARGYGLRVDEYVDERRDPEKSTDAALRYLRDLHRQFGSWYLAAAAYNGGDGRVSRTMKSVLGREKGSGEGDYWRIRHRLPRETREYVPRMLAAALIGKEPQKYGLGNVSRQLPLSADTVSVPGGTELAAVARAAGVEEKELAKLNPQLIKRMTPPGDRPFLVRVPEGRAEAFATGFDRVAAEANAVAERERERARVAAEKRAAERRAAARTHTVRRGESLWTIARRNDTTVRAIQRANGLGSRTKLRLGQKLVIPR